MYPQEFFSTLSTQIVVVTSQYLVLGVSNSELGVPESSSTRLRKHTLSEHGVARPQIGLTKNVAVAPIRLTLRDDGGG